MGAQKISIAVAIFVGLAAALGIFLFVRGLESDSVAEGETTTVYVVNLPFERGADKAQVLDSIEERQIQASFAPVNAISDPSVDIPDGFVAIADFGVGHTVVRSDFASERVAGSGLSAALSEGEVSVTIQTDPISWAAGLIKPGDRVNVLAVGAPDQPWWGDERDTAFEAMTAQARAEMIAARAATRLESVFVPIGLRQALGVSNAAEVPTFEELSAAQKQSAIVWVAENDDFSINNALSRNDSKYLLQNVRVLAIDSTIAAGIGDDSESAAPVGAAGTALVTLAVQPEDVQLVLNASQANSKGGDGIYLSLVPPEYEASAIPPLDPTRQVAPGEDPTALVSITAGNILNSAGGITQNVIASQPNTLAATDSAEEETQSDTDTETEG